MMRRVVSAILAVCLLPVAGAPSFAEEASAPVNFQLFPVYGTIEGTMIVYTAWVISYRDSKLYRCNALTKDDAAPTLACRAEGKFDPPLLTGGNVITSQILGLAPENTASLAPYFWQIDQGTGQVQFCEEPGVLPQVKTCAAAQIP